MRSRLSARPARSRSDNEGAVELNGCSSMSLSARAARSRSTNDGASDMVSSSSSARRLSRLLRVRPWALARELCE
eukprot:scaffold57841_cov58-Phaeocystis_antarctica.AAC.5